MNMISGLAQGGGTCFWSISCSVNRARLEEELRPLNLARFTPNERTHSAALKAAIETSYASGPDTKVIPRKKQSENGFELLEIDRREEGNKYQPVASARVSEGGIVHVTSGADRMDDEKLQLEFNLAKSTIAGSAVGHSLCEILDEMRATRLRPSGGVYFIPPSQVDKWLQVRTAIERSAEEAGKCQLFFMQAQMDDETLKAICFSIREEILAEAAAINAELSGGELGDKAVENRKLKANRLTGKVKLYATIVGESLKDLEKALEDCVSNEAVATMQMMPSVGAA